MGMVIGVILIGIALAVGVGIMVVANQSVKNFREDQYVHYASNK